MKRAKFYFIRSYSFLVMPTIEIVCESVTGGHVKGDRYIDIEIGFLFWRTGFYINPKI